MNSRLIRKINMSVINFFILFAVLGVAEYALARSGHLGAALTVLLLMTLVTALNVVLYFAKQKERMRRIRALSFYADAGGAATHGTVDAFCLPLVFLSDEGKYIWGNAHFTKLFPNDRTMKHELQTLYLLKLCGKADASGATVAAPVDMADRSFLMMANVVRSDKGNTDTLLWMVYFTETTELTEMKKRFTERQTAVGEIAIDSYEEIFQSSGEAVINAISVELGKIFDKWLADSHAVVKKLVRDRYVLIVEETALREMERNKFSVLDMAKKISVGNRIPVTLSIGIGAHAPSVSENYNAASQALELALSRGGDQAVVRDGSGDAYYGGSNLELESSTKVKARVVASLLKEEILKSSRVLIMGHQTADMDALGSTLCVYRACSFLGVKARIVLNESNPSIEQSLKRLQQESEYEEVFINTSYALNLVDEDTLTVVVDTSLKSMTECPKLLDYAPRIAVFDHHRKTANYLKDTVLDYSETYASSTCELLLEVLQYMIPKISIPVNEAEAMYAGILVDTKNFTFKTGSRTFEVAAYLRSQGVDTVSVKRYFQPDMETYATVSQVTASARLIADRIALAHCPVGVRNQKLVTAMAADNLLNISGVDASFVLSDRDGGIAISARSLGEINVQVILEKLGGGGHLAAAATVMADVSMEYAERELVKHIMEYLEK